ncbi:MAG: IS21 family transposase [Butyrivibrio sp.]|nr:IS21 family transposase [Butyrivibrio sp.]
MKDYNEIRKRYLAGESQRHIAKTLGISRNTVAKYCEGAAVPWERKTPERTSTVLTDEAVSFIRSCLKEDQDEKLKKQKHTAKRIYERLVEETGFTGGESTVRAKVHELRQTLPDVFLPLMFDPGEAVQADWGEAYVYINAERIKVNLFCIRLCYSCRPVVLAYHRQNEESFLDAFVRSFQIFGGVPAKVIFDNGKVAVKDGFGSHAKKQDSYTALSAHYGFEALFCNPAEGHEKGLVEGLVGWARRNILVPVPKVGSMQELNELLLSRCERYEVHQVKGRADTVGAMFLAEKESLRPLPKYIFETAKCLNARVNAFSTVCFRTNRYSVPVAYAGRMVGIKAYPEKVRIFADGSMIAEHERCFGKYQNCYHLEDYLPLLEVRGRAFFNAAPVRQNIPPEILEEWRRAHTDHKTIITFLKGEPEELPSVIKDPVRIRQVDLHEYDFLKEAAYVY